MLEVFCRTRIVTVNACLKKTFGIGGPDYVTNGKLMTDER